MPPQPAAQQAPKQATDAQYYRQVLHELIDIATDLARNIHQQATAHPGSNAQTPKPPPAPRVPANDPAPDLALAFDRIARCVRRTVALARALAEPPRQPPAQQRPARHRTSARKRIIRAVEDVIHRRATGPRAEALQAELNERLDAPEFDDDLDRPTAEIIAEICRDLGLDDMPGSHPRKRRTPADVASLHARAARPCNPQPGTTPRAPTPAARPAPAITPGVNLPADPAEAVAHVLRYAALHRRE